MLSRRLPLQAAVDHIVSSMASTINDVDRQSVSLQAKTSTDAVRDETKRLISAYQSLAIGVLTFSVTSPRYGLSGGWEEAGGGGWRGVL